MTWLGSPTLKNVRSWPMRLGEKVAARTGTIRRLNCGLPATWADSAGR
ncbi:MAG: hypothetical protein RMJ56_15525 [Gemmataceae bacterium]|nr:hypothetical protein [Gemmata sp.]MDW8199007.1 hypothetical protein [Gemmataceae bacterium]